MKCPIDDSPLSVSSREGVEIDFCPQCRGVWLDRGELDQILERERGVVAGVQDDDEEFFREMSGGGKKSEQHREQYGFDKRTAERLLGDYRSHQKHKKKKKSFLDELFD